MPSASMSRASLQRLDKRLFVYEASCISDEVCSGDALSLGIIEPSKDKARIAAADRSRRR
jgi:hypothetical protein